VGREETDCYEEVAEIGEDVGCLEGLCWVGGCHCGWLAGVLGLWLLFFLAVVEKSTRLCQEDISRWRIFQNSQLQLQSFKVTASVIGERSAVSAPRIPRSCLSSERT
jgi:hypothetical protein